MSVACFTCLGTTVALSPMTNTCYWNILQSLLLPDQNIVNVCFPNPNIHFCTKCKQMLQSISKFKDVAVSSVRRQLEHWNQETDPLNTTCTINADSVYIKEEKNEDADCNRKGVQASLHDEIMLDEPDDDETTCQVKTEPKMIMFTEDRQEELVNRLLDSASNIGDGDGMENKHIEDMVINFEPVSKEATRREITRSKLADATSTCKTRKRTKESEQPSPVKKKMSLSSSERQKRYRERMRLQNPEKYEMTKRKNAERNKMRRKIEDYDDAGKKEVREKWRRLKRKQNDKGLLKMPLSSSEKQKRYRERMRLQDPEKYEMTKRKNAERNKMRRKIEDYDEAGKKEVREKWRRLKRKQNDKGLLKKGQCYTKKLNKHELEAYREQVEASLAFQAARHKCNTCLVVFHTGKSSREHETICHSKKYNTECVVCQQTMPAKLLTKHIASHFEIIECSECGYRSNDGDTMKYHSCLLC